MSTIMVESDMRGRTRGEQWARAIRKLLGKHGLSLVGAALQTALGEHERTLAGLPQKRPVRRGKTDRARLEAKRKRIVQAWVSGFFTLEERDRQLAEVDSRLAAVVEEKAPSAITPEAVRTLIAALGPGWAALSQETRRGLLTAIDARITLCTRRHVRLWVEMLSRLTAAPVRAEGRDYAR